MKNLTTEERKNRILARGEFSNHAHVMIGDCEVELINGKTLIHINDDQNSCLRHLLEKPWMEGSEIWTGEHTDIYLRGLPQQVRHGDVLLNKCGERTYEYVRQMVFDPITKRIEASKD